MMLRVALRIRHEAVEEVLDELLPLLPAGIHQTELEPGVVEIAAFGMAGHLPSREALEAAAGEALLAPLDERQVPVDWRERRRLFGRGFVIAGRLSLRSPLDPPPPPDLVDVVVERTEGAFGTGAHPTTRGALELMLGIDPGGPFADLGCGTGTLAIAAAKLGWAPVIAVDYMQQSVEATRANAARNGVPVEVHLLDLLEEDPPPARTIAANVPPVVHRRIAAALDPEVEHVIVSGIVAADSEAILELYAAAGMPVSRDLESGEGWTTVLLERSGG